MGSSSIGVRQSNLNLLRISAGGGVLDVGNEDVEACSGDGDVDCRGSGGHIDYGVGG